MARDDDELQLRTPEDIDAEIARLQRERDRLTWLRTDPEQRAAREARRDQVMARWARGRGLVPEQLAEIHQLAGARDAWMWEDDWLTADGWQRDESDRWTGPAD